MARYLLDSHVFLWLDSPKSPLKREHAAMLMEPENRLYVSVASIWELAIKRMTKRLEFGGSFSMAAKAKDIIVLPVYAEHAEAVEKLTVHHRDPFDHMLVAQAIVEDLVLVTHDAKLHAYNVPMMRV